MTETIDKDNILHEIIERNSREGYTIHIEFHSKTGFELACMYLIEEGVTHYSSFIDNLTQRRYIFLKPETLTQSQIKKLQELKKILLTPGISDIRSEMSEKTGRVLN